MLFRCLLKFLGLEFQEFFRLLDKIRVDITAAKYWLCICCGRIKKRLTVIPSHDAKGEIRLPMHRHGMWHMGDFLQQGILGVICIEG